MGTKKKKLQSAGRMAGPPRRRTTTKVRSINEQGPEAARLQAELRECIERDIAARIDEHQHDVARIRMSARRGNQQAPLALLAHGDSWFNYPLKGNSISFSDTDIIAHLKRMGSPPPKILNISHYGDATTDEMGLAKQKRLIKALRDPKNWLTGKPDAILFSGGGNDIAGDPFCIYLNYKDSHLPGLDQDRFASRLASIHASYRDLFDFRTRYAPSVPILGHCYDWARPMRPHPPCAGPWMLPSLTFAGWNAEEGRQIIHDALKMFADMLLGLEGGGFDFTVVPTQGTLSEKDWANELHPHPDGFRKLAEVFLSTLQSRFPGRV